MSPAGEVIVTEDSIDATRELEVYFYQDDGIYKLSSKEPEPSLVLSNQLEETFKNSYQEDLFALMGPDNNWLVYKIELGKHALTGQISYGLVIYDLENKVELLRVVDQDRPITSFKVSPSGLKLAYVENFYSSPKTSGQEISTTTSLYVWEGGGSPKQLLFHQSPASFLMLGMWLDETSLTAGYAFEGVQYCSFNTIFDKELVSDCSPHYGRSMMGIVDSLKAVDQAGAYYGFHYEYKEIVGDKKSADGIFRQSLSGEREFIISDIASDLVVSGQNIYYLRNGQDASKHMWNGAASDLYAVTTDGMTTRRLTNDSSSVTTKSNLNLSADGRFLAYQVTDLSKISPETNSLAEHIEHSSVWLYDTLLNKYYQVAKSAIIPKVVLR